MLRRWSWVILAVTVVGAVVGGVLLASGGSSYTSEALVQVRPIVSQSDDPNLDTNRQINPETEEAIAGSQRVAERALAVRSSAAALGMADLGAAEVIAAARDVDVDADEARDAVELLTVSVVSDSQILAFEATADSPSAARDLAQSSAVAYLEFRRDEAMVGNGESRQRLEAREQELLAELAALTGNGAAGVDLDEVPADGALAFVEVAKRQELSVIGTKYANLESLTVDPGVILTDAGLPTAADGLPFVAGPVMGALLGLVVALTGVFILDRADDRLRSGRVELGALGAPMLGTAPVVRSRPRRRSSETGPEIYPVNSEGSDAYRRLQGTLLFNLDNDNRNLVLVAGVSDPDVGTEVVANLGATAARAGRRTLLVGADLRNDALGGHLGAGDGPGLSDVILSNASLAESIRPVDGVDNLYLLDAGNQLEQPAHVLQSHAFARLAAAIQADYDLVVVEAPPVLRAADAVDIAGWCDGSVVVADGRSESRQAIAESLQQLRGVGSDIVGVVVAERE